MFSVRGRARQILPVVVMAFGLMLLSSCATVDSNGVPLPGPVTMNKEAGRGGMLVITLRLDNGEKLPFVVDTGSPWTLLDKSEESKLGKRLDSGTLWNFGVKQDAYVYQAPKLFLGRTPLIMNGTNIIVYDPAQLSSPPGRPASSGILGMDVLVHYCLQLDFNRGRIRFLNAEHADKSQWGKPFPLTDIGDGCFYIKDNLVGAKGPGSIIDTGCDYFGWLTPALYRQWTNQTPLPPAGEARSPDGILGGEIYHELDLRGVNTNELAGGDTHIPYNGIGLHLLSENLVTFDFARETMYLKRTSQWALADRDLTASANSMAESAYKYLKRLRKSGRLPGWTTDAEISQHGRAFHYTPPGTITFDLPLTAGSSVLHYSVVRAAKDSYWKLQKAWRSDADGRAVQPIASHKLTLH